MCYGMGERCAAPWGDKEGRGGRSLCSCGHRVPIKKRTLNKDLRERS